MRGNNKKTYAPRVPPITSIRELGSWIYEEFRRLSSALDGADATVDLDDYYDKVESDARFAPIVHDHNTLYYTKAQIDAGYAVISHNHDSRYYTETESDARYSLTSHNHDSRYYTETESDARYSLTSHTHTSFTAPLNINGASSSNRLNVNGGTNEYLFFAPGIIAASAVSANTSFVWRSNGIDKAYQEWDYSASAFNTAVAGTNVKHQLLNTGGARLYFSTSANYAMLWQPDGHVYIWNNGTVLWDAGVSASDSTLKNNVRDIKSPLETVGKIRGVEFEWNDNMPEDMVGKSSIGVIAQELELVLPELVYNHKGPDGEDSTKTVDYAKLTVLLVEAVKELSARVKALENESIRNNSTSTS